ncbi:MAG: ABC transporter permease [Dehalococcoidia bacterium]
MLNYIVRRLLLLIPLLFGLSIVIFAVMRSLPGDPAAARLGPDAEPESIAAVRDELNLDEPLAVQYLTWVGNVTRGDMGDSYLFRSPVTEQIQKRLPVTVELVLFGMFVTILLGVPSGILSALKRNSGLDYGIRVLNVLLLAVPGFWLATLMLLLPSLWWGYAPPIGYTPIWDNPMENLEQFYMPALALAAASAAVVMRMTRSVVLEVLSMDYIRTARAKGLSQRGVVLRHVLKNASIPVLSLVALQATVLIGGQVVVEQIFTMPGVGRLLVESVLLRDYNVVQGVVLYIAAAVLIINLAADISYAYLDPRIKYS